jgi:hypothetical protein
MLRIFLAITALFAFVRLAPAQTTRASQGLFDPERHMRVSEVRPGMKGYGLSVFSGTKIERFDVEVLSVLRNFNPQQHVLLVRLAKQNLEHSGGIAGMSGSPIYLIDDDGRERLVGAFAYGWILSKDPVGGVQPIEYMLDIPDDLPDAQAAAPKAGARWMLHETIALPGFETPERFPFARWGSLEPNPNLANAPDAQRLRPLMVPMAVGGASREVVAAFDAIFRSYGLAPMQAGGGAALDGPAPKLEPGSALALPLVMGDVDMSAIGTTTEVIGDRVFGFGHAFNAEGAVRLPMGSGYINGVISSLLQSFKLGGMAELQGTLYGDSNVGVAGKVGEVPPLTDLSLRVVYADGSHDHTYRYQGIMHPMFSPLIGGFVVATSMTAWNDLPENHTVEYDITITFTNGEVVAIQNVSVNESFIGPYFDVLSPLFAASQNPFGRVLPAKIDGTVTIRREARSAEVLSVNVPRLKLKPGEVVKGYVTCRPFRGEEVVLPFEMPLPKDLPAGQYALSVGDSRRYLRDEYSARPFRFAAENIDEVFDVLRDFASIRSDAMYVRLLRRSDGVAVGRVAMPALPASRRQVLLGSGRSNVTPFVSSAVRVVPTPFTLSGSADFVVTIEASGKPAVGADAREPATTQPAAE